MPCGIMIRLGFGATEIWVGILRLCVLEYVTRGLRFLFYSNGVQT